MHFFISELIEHSKHFLLPPFQKGYLRDCYGLCLQDSFFILKAWWTFALIYHDSFFSLKIFLSCQPSSLPGKFQGSSCGWEFSLWSPMWQPTWEATALHSIWRKKWCWSGKLSCMKPWYIYIYACILWGSLVWYFW